MQLSLEDKPYIMIYEHIKPEDFKWEDAEPGIKIARVSDFEVRLSIVKGRKGATTTSHSHSHGSFIYITKGKIKIETFILTPGTAGACRPGPGHYHAEFLEDSEYIVCRSTKDIITKYEDMGLSTG